MTARSRITFNQLSALLLIIGKEKSPGYMIQEYFAGFSGWDVETASLDWSTSDAKVFIYNSHEHWIWPPV